ncbi:MAG: flagellar export chaperone FliS [Nitrosomonadales bacterium]|nr:flagellar export chaperone FliS [Nitrosomonadales bacterium]
MNATSSIKAYNDVRLETGVPSADPHKLILMLYQGALLAIASAKNQVLRKEIAGKGASITKAIAIIDEGLKASLDRNAGGDLAQNLSALYDYMSHRLLVANLKNDVAALDEVSRLLSDLKGAWEAIRPVAVPPKQAAPAPGPQPPARPAALTYGRI